MEFVSLPSAVWRTDRWTGRLTDNGDANVASDTPSETLLWLLSQPLVPVPIKRDSFIPCPRFLQWRKLLRWHRKLLNSGSVHKTTWDREMFFHLSSSTRSVTSSFLSAAIDARAQLSQSECVFKCFPVWEISVKWSCLSARLFLARVMGSPGGICERIQIGGCSEEGESYNLIRIWFELIN